MNRTELLALCDEIKSLYGMADKALLSAIEEDALTLALALKERLVEVEDKTDVTRAGWVREWEGDESDLGHMLFVSDDDEKDDNPNWAPVYYLTPEQIEALKSYGFRLSAAEVGR